MRALEVLCVGCLVLSGCSFLLEKPSLEGKTCTASSECGGGQCVNGVCRLTGSAGGGSAVGGGNGSSGGGSATGGGGSATGGGSASAGGAAATVIVIGGLRTVSGSGIGDGGIRVVDDGFESIQRACTPDGGLCVVGGLVP